MFRDFTLSLEQLPSRPFLNVLAKSLALTLVIFVILAIGLSFGVDWGLEWLEAKDWVSEEGWWLSGIIGGLLAVLAAWVLFRAIAIPVMGLFGDSVVQAVEERHYPVALSSARPVPFDVAARMGLASLSRVILWNLLASPLYLILLITGVGLLIAFLAVNALLLGRDLGEMVAVRHLDREGVKSWLAQTKLSRALLGAFMTMLFLIPIANLVAPLIGAAMATHLFHRSLKA